MKLLVLAVLAVVASAKGDYHDDVFHFSTVNRPVAVSPAYSQYYSQPSQYYGQYSAYASQPLSSAQYKPAVSTYVSQPAVSTYVSQPAVSYVSQPAVSYVSSAQYKPAVSTYVSQPAVGTYVSQPAVSYVSQPAVSYVSSAQYKPAVSTYASKPAVSYVSSEYKPAVSTYVSQSAVSTYSQPAVSTYSQYAAKPFTYYQQTPVLKEVVYQQPQPLYSQVSVPVSSYSALGSSHLSSYAPAYNGPQYRILKQVQEVDPSGPYRMQYATENGISASEEGTLTAAGPEGPAVAKHGSYSYTGPDGVQYTVNWVADENGYRASGAHLPQAPEVPVVEAQRSLNFASPQFFRSSFYKK